jgi:anaerobic selenocysteine-containing dehydrogenase
MCGLRVETHQGRLVRIRGDRGHPLSRGWICRRGTAFAGVHNDPDRLRHPLRRNGSRFEQVGWEEALTGAAARLAEIRGAFGPDAVAVYMGNPVAFCTYGAMAVPAFVKALGTASFYTSGSQDCNNKFAASERVFGSPVMHPVPDLDHVDFLLILGGNPAVTGMSFVQTPRPAETLRKIRKRGGEVVVVDPRRTETARLASEHLFIRPDTDSFFLMSLLWVMMDRGKVDRRWAGEDAEGYAALEEVVRPWPPERTEAVTGIPARKTVEIALRLCGSRPSACYGSVGINLGTSGTLTYWLILMVNLLSGHFDRKGGSLMPRGVMDAAKLLDLSGVGRSKRRSPTGQFLPVMGSWPASLLAEQILGGREPRIRALVVVAGNPLLSIPNEKHLKEALQRLDLLVCLDLYKNETGGFAHYLLPTTDFLERDDFNFSHMSLQFRRYAAYTRAVVPPDGEQLQEWEILDRLCGKMDIALWGRAVKTLRRVVGGRSVTPRLLLRLLLRVMGEKDFRTLAASPRGVLLAPQPCGALRNRKGLRGRRFRVRLAPRDLLHEARKLEDRIPFPEKTPGAFLLIGKRERHTHNTWLHNVDSLLRGETTNYLYMHPEDASENGIEEGAAVQVRNAGGNRLQIPCRFSAELMRGVVAMPHGWGHRFGAGWRKAKKRPGVNVNRLMSDAPWDLEPITGNAWMNGIPVDVRPLKGA